jgi:hypothetical protein
MTYQLYNIRYLQSGGQQGLHQTTRQPCASAPPPVDCAPDLPHEWGMTRFLRLPAVLIGLVPAVLAAAPYDGVYRQTANAECALIGVDGGSVRIAAGIFYGVETQCQMTRPVDVNGMEATLYTMECVADGEQWTERAMLMRTADGEGLYMIWDGYVFVYSICEEGVP